MRCFFLFGFVAVSLVCLRSPIEASRFRGLYAGLKEPEVNQPLLTTLDEKWIKQPVNHFNARDNRTWLMRYYEKTEYSNNVTGAPILIMLGGEWAITPNFLFAGQMYEIARTHKAIMYYTEHRYYGKSRPVNDTSPENLQYLNADQALADVAFFIETKKKENVNLTNSTVIVFGASYAGNLAAWARIKYPHLIQGALASSAPVRAKANFFEYYEVVAHSLARFDKQCLTDVKEAFDTVQLFLSDTDGRSRLKSLFNLCEVPSNSSVGSLGYFGMALVEQFANVMQFNKIGVNGTSSIGKLCSIMTNNSISEPIVRLGKLVAGEYCVEINYEDYMVKFKNTSWGSTTDDNFRLYYYQLCSEFGHYQTSDSSNSAFGNFLPLEFYVQMCSDLYGKYYGLSLLEASVRRTNVMYGGSLPDVTNVIFTNGNIDPWHVLSVLKDLNKYSPAILIDGSSHCKDLEADEPTDPAELKKARLRVRSIIAEWIKRSRLA